MENIDSRKDHVDLRLCTEEDILLNFDFLVLLFQAQFISYWNSVDQPPFQCHDFGAMDADETRKKIRKKRKSSNGPFFQLVEPIEESVFLKISVQSLEEAMKKSPLEISVHTIEENIGSVIIPWSQDYFLYLEQIKQLQNPLPIEVLEKCHIISDLRFKHTIALELRIRLSNFKDKTKNSQLTAVYPELNSSFYSNNRYCADENITENGKIVIRNKVNKLDSKKSTKRKSKTQAKLGIENEYLDNLYDKIELNEKKELGTSTKTRETKKNVLENFIDTVVKDELSAALRKEIFNDLRPNKSVPSLLTMDNIKTNSDRNEKKQYSFGNKVFYVGYCSCNEDVRSEIYYPPPASSVSENELHRTQWRQQYTVCTSETQCKAPECTKSTCSLGLPIEIFPHVHLTKCENTSCEVKEIDEVERKQEIYVPVCGDTDENRLIDNCYCTCECVFNFVRETTYCKVCGGYEEMGEDLFGVAYHELPTPCPVYHNLMDAIKPVKPEKKKKRERATTLTDDGKKDNKIECWFDYAAPKKYHGNCVLGCCPHVKVPVPYNMGWLWSSGNVPGIKFRPFWKPGACSRNVIAMFKAARNPGEVKIKKKKKKEPKKKLDKRPLLVVHKKDGTFKVTLETMKIYPKPRTFNQQPYEDKPPLTYTIGRTEEENMERQKKKERMQRRLERDQRNFIESAFTNICDDVCTKTYQQAIQILPDAEGPGCSCFIRSQNKNTQSEYSCSCSEDKNSLESETDDDEWFVEFTAPIAKYDSAFKPIKLIKTEASTQYTYLDYRVKLRDKSGNEVPRYFIGPDGRKQCSDLGGFWDPNKKWLKINKDGFIGADKRWAPLSFTGPCDEKVDIDIDEGKFQDSSGNWLTVGVDGYVDCNNKWRYYPLTKDQLAERRKAKQKEKQKEKQKTKLSSIKHKNLEKEPVQENWQCFGDGVTTDVLAQLGITGHGHDKRILIKKINEMIAKGQNIIVRQTAGVPPSKLSESERNRIKEEQSHFYQEYICTHPKPSKKGVVAVDTDGNKTYFKIFDTANRRPRIRMQSLKDRGIPVSSFHVPCFSSFIGVEEMKKQQRARLIELAKRFMDKN
ncbi:hypothetical protein EVAR_99019_1 [Eumeta japonica]|uniref:DUF4776 domain-containing protein n=1 Tax=Eumeta variegata TaxID=151549 RepID=A0A4C1Y2I8_EUMVA|nr:hypothetical protein EVAR_99019_1 [Eumeta japonica]